MGAVLGRPGWRRKRQRPGSASRCVHRTPAGGTRSPLQPAQRHATLPGHLARDLGQRSTTAVVEFAPERPPVHQPELAPLLPTASSTATPLVVHTCRLHTGTDSASGSCAFHPGQPRKHLAVVSALTEQGCLLTFGASTQQAIRNRPSVPASDLSTGVGSPPLLSEWLEQPEHFGQQVRPFVSSAPATDCRNTPSGSNIRRRLVCVQSLAA